MPELTGLHIMVAIGMFFIGVSGFLLFDSWWRKRKFRKAACECGDLHCEGYDVE